MSHVTGLQLHVVVIDYGNVRQHSFTRRQPNSHCSWLSHFSIFSWVSGLAPPKSDPVFNTAEENKRAARAGQVQYKTPALNRHRRYLKELAEARKAAAAKAAEEEEAKVAHMTKLRETSKSIRKAIAEGVPEKAKAKAFATPRDTPRDTPRPGSGASGVKATPRGSKKPAWAMTGKEADDVEKAEAEELLAFSESLDIGEFLHDFEVRQALEAVQSRIDTLKAGGDAGIDQGGEASDGGDNEDQGEQLHSGASNGEQGEGDELGGSHGQDRIDLTKEGWKGEFASWWNRAVASGSSDDWETSSTRPSRDGLESVSERSSGGSDTPRVRRDSDMVSSVSSMSRISRASNLTTLSSGSHASLKAVLAENMGSIRQVHSPASLRAVINRMMAQKKARGGSGGGDGQEEGGSQDLRKSVTWAEQASIRGGSTSGTIQSLLAQQSGSGIGRGN